MRQQVNLYQPSRLPSGPRLSGGMLLLVLGTVGGGLLLVGGLMAWRTAQMEQNLAALEAARRAQTAQLADLQRQYPPARPDPRLEEKIRELEAGRDRKEAIRRLLASGEPGNSRGFSPLLEALARQDLPGTWLRRIALASGGEEILLLGSALAPEQTPLLLQRLGQEEALAGVEFRRMQLTRVAEEQGSRIDFMLATTEETREGKR